MSDSSPLYQAVTALSLLFSAGQAAASSGNPVTRIDEWKPRTEILEYHSCGMADMCWVAEVRYKNTRQRLAVLRCDGEKLYSRLGRQPEGIAAENCNAFENSDKFQEIPKALRTLLNR